MIVVQREDGYTTGPRPVVVIDSGPGRPLNHFEPRFDSPTAEPDRARQGQTEPDRARQS